MKKTLLVFLLSCFIKTLSAQVVFCAPGAHWQYLFKYISPNGTIYSRGDMYYSGDTIVGADTIKILKYISFYPFNTVSYCHSVLIKQKGDTIFMKNCETLGKWQILYNFAAGIGDSWKTTVRDSGYYSSHATLTHTITVNSVSTVTLNGMSLKKLNVTSCVPSIHSAAILCGSVNIIERIGCTGYAFNYNNMPINGDINMLNDFLCYKDNAFGSMPFSQKGCDYNVGIAENNFDNEDIKLYPQPAGNVINIDLPRNNYGFKIQIFDLSGRVLLKTYIQAKTQLDISSLTSGFYCLTVSDQNNKSTTHKIIKE